MPSFFANTIRPTKCIQFPVNIIFSFLIVLILASSSNSHLNDTEHFDLLLINGQILDGTGNPWFYGDIGIRDGKIVKINNLHGAHAERVLNVAGKIISPGFIDLHSHADGVESFENGLRSPDAHRRAAPNLVSQGITTVVVNQDGRSPWPIHEQMRQLEESGFGPNAILMIGFGTVRQLVMSSDFRRPASTDEILEMKRLVKQGMNEGAYGISAGLEYDPDRWSSKKEIIAVVDELVPYGGVYIAHQRSEGADPMWYWPSQDGEIVPNLLESVRETIEIGERTDATVVASHIKVKGANYWGTSDRVIALIQQARDRGVSIWADQYPYNTSGTDGNTVLIPLWPYEIHSGNTKADYATLLQKALQDHDTEKTLREDILHEILRRGGAENLIIIDYPDSSYIGKSLAELARTAGKTAVDMALELQFNGFPSHRGGAIIRGFSMSESDIEAFAAQSWTATSTDAGIALPGDRLVHPRYYGAFPRKIHHYAMERGIMTVAEAVRSATSLPAQILGLRNRGLIQEGNWADIVVFDLKYIRDRATVFQPHQYPEGIEYVLINGQFVLENGTATGQLPGRIITPDSYREFMAESSAAK